jgi:hypothetical protein
MSYVVFLLSLLLLAGGFAGAYFSLDLLPTSMGVLYALAGAGAIAMAVLTACIGVLIRRIDRLTASLRETARLPIIAHPAPIPVSLADAAPPVAPPLAHEEAPLAVAEEAMTTLPPETEAETATLAESESQLETADEDDPINENRVGHLPSLSEIEHAIETPETPPALIGRYSSGGANYMIFADGSIEAETEEGAYKFGSMGDFKQFLADRRGAG